MAALARTTSLLRAQLLSGSAIVALSLPFAAYAQEAVQLEEVTVTSASGKATSLQDAPASITVLSAEDIAASGAKDLKDVLRTVPGLNLTRGNDGNSSVSFRGMSASRSLTLVDGKRVGTRNTFARHYGGDLSMVAIDAIERIEVVRGPMSTLYGSDAMGGVINIITKKDSANWSGSVTTDMSFADDSYTGETSALSGQISGPVGKNLTFSAWSKFSRAEAPDEPYGLTLSRGTWTPNFTSNGTDTRSLGARLTWTPTDAMEWGFEASGNSERYKGAPEYFNPNTGLTVAEAHDTNKVKTKSFGITNEWMMGTGTLSSYLRHEKSDNASWNSTAGDWNTPIKFENTTLETRYNALGQAFGKELDYTLGFMAAQEKLDDRTTTAGSVIAGTANTAAIYGEGRLRFSDALTLTGGLRVDHHDEFGVNASPRLYANYDLGNGMTLKAGYSQAFVAPTLRNLNPNYSMGSNGNGCKPYQGPCTIIGNPNLKPETSDNYEIGVNVQGERTSWEVTAFYNDVENMISARRTGEFNDAGRPLFQRDNFDYGKTAGVEAGFNTQVNDKLQWTGTATWIAKSEFKYGDFDTAYPMATTPEWNISTGVTYQATDRLNLQAHVNYIGKQAGFVIADGLVVGEGEQASVPAGQNSKAYYLVNVGARYDLTDKASVSLGIDNIFNGSPESSVDYREDGRLFRVGLTTRF